MMIRGQASRGKSVINSGLQVCVFPGLLSWDSTPGTASNSAGQILSWCLSCAFAVSCQDAGAMLGILFSGEPSLCGMITDKWGQLEFLIFSAVPISSFALALHNWYILEILQGLMRRAIVRQTKYTRSHPFPFGCHLLTMYLPTAQSFNQ